MGQNQILMGRQPILDRSQNIVGFELLFRSTENLEAAVINSIQGSIQASANVIAGALGHFGLEEVIGKRHKGFINVSAELLMDDAVELLPKQQVVIELLESIEVNQGVVERCRDLKALGFSLALDDFLCQPAYEPLLEIVDIVKIDLLQMTPSSLQEAVQRLRYWPLTLVAEKVEDREQFDRCMTMGFELFQGYYFARPTVISGKRIDPAMVSLLKLMDQVLNDTGIEEIEKTFKENPFLTYNLLRLVNSVAAGTREKISSLRHAIVMLGRQQLKRWVQLLLFCGDKPGDVSPLLQTAAMRGRLMELLAGAQSLNNMTRTSPDLAFMTGILSLIDTLLCRPMEEIVDQLGLADEVRRGLLAHEGPIGRLLLLVRNLEREDFQEVVALLTEFQLTLSHLRNAQLEAIAWTNSISEAVA